MVIIIIIIDIMTCLVYVEPDIVILQRNTYVSLTLYFKASQIINKKKYTIVVFILAVFVWKLKHATPNH